ncbi:hypothetical protein HPP92_004427 [Vanilla planifolia]|uniref:Uncharacterized protein n=1 Tax=Vanilla planifolia TaxID=51239 RepID=A0A835VDL9_VANPL|nr:hypothetical protein HPP92_004840 [Vanilla planifolia]KAG0493433.1 hypothetical protein HPP92_004427 [Vanilla planifolia]
MVSEAKVPGPGKRRRVATARWGLTEVGRTVVVQRRWNGITVWETDDNNGDRLRSKEKSPQ